MRVNGRIKGRCRNAFVFRQQIVREFVEIRDSPNHCRRRHELIAIREKFLHLIDVLGVSLNETIAGMLVVRLLTAAVFAEIVEPDNFMPIVEQLLNQITANEPGCAGD